MLLGQCFIAKKFYLKFFLLEFPKVLPNILSVAHFRSSVNLCWDVLRGLVVSV